MELESVGFFTDVFIYVLLLGVGIYVGITFGIYDGSKMGSSDGLFDVSNDGKLYSFIFR